MGTKLLIQSSSGSFLYGVAVAGDTGSAVKGNTIDLYFDSASECYAFGRRTCTVYVLS
ncbi:MAG: 3D domain-containing protein [Clostridiales bacterium]|nr:3D domain-containing protein [Clostridiales bacterium]